MRSPPPYSDLPKYPVTGGTLLLAIGVTIIWQTHLVDITPLLETGEIRRGELWRLVTSTLPHVNVLHLIFNLYWTWVFGTLAESVFGHLRTLAIFVLLAIVSNGGEYALLSGGVGLSGIGYGLFGLMWVLSRRDRRFADAVDSATVQMFVAWFFLCIVMTVAGYPIANVAHGVGCLTGALLGWTISANSRERAAGIFALALIAAAVLAGDTLYRPIVNLSKYAGGDFAKEAGFDEAHFGDDAFSADNNQQALRWFRDAVQLNPKEPGFWYNLGVAYERTSNRTQAIAAYQKACDLNPIDAQYRSALDGLK
jgi:membrane associated rhomboid family serine protease